MWSDLRDEAKCNIKIRSRFGIANHDFQILSKYPEIGKSI